MPRDGALLLSDYPAPKVRVACRCGIAASYDKAAMLKAGGDRPLPTLLVEIARRKGCDRAGKAGADSYRRCMAVYEM